MLDERAPEKKKYNNSKDKYKLFNMYSAQTIIQTDDDDVNIIRANSILNIIVEESK